MLHAVSRKQNLYQQAEYSLGHEAFGGNLQRCQQLTTRELVSLTCAHLSHLSFCIQNRDEDVAGEPETLGVGAGLEAANIADMHAFLSLQVSRTLLPLPNLVL